MSKSVVLANVPFLDSMSYVYEVTNPKVAISMVKRTKNPSGADDDRVGCLGLI